MEQTDSLEFNVELSSYTASLEILLDLAKAQKVDLEKISVTKLDDQFNEFITKSKNNLRTKRYIIVDIKVLWKKGIAIV